MTPMAVILYAAVTVVVLIAIFAVAYYFSTAKRIKKQQERLPQLIDALKPGVRVIFAGGFVGTFLSKDDQNIFAKIQLNDKTIVEVAVYSIANILDA